MALVSTHDSTPVVMGRKDLAANVAHVERLDEDYAGGGIETAKEAIQPAQPDELLYEQQQAYNIVTAHLAQTILGRQPDQLLLQI